MRDLPWSTRWVVAQFTSNDDALAGVVAELELESNVGATRWRRM